jgi:hypothetical protein
MRTPRRADVTVTNFLAACADGAAPTVIGLLRHDATLVHYRVNTVILQDALRKRGYGVGSTGLMLAAERGHLATVRALLEHGANPNWSPSRGDTDPTRSVKHPLIHACMNGHWRCMSELLNKGANPNAVSDMGTPLELLAYRHDIIKPKTNVDKAYAALQDAGAETKMTSEGKWTPSDRTTIREHLKSMHATYVARNARSARERPGRRPTARPGRALGVGTSRRRKRRRASRPTSRRVANGGVRTHAS